MPTRAELEQLAGRLRDLQAPPAAHRPLPTGWGAIDRALTPHTGPAGGEREPPTGGLPGGAIHEWFLDLEERPAPASAPPDRDNWFAPLALLTHLAWRTIEAGDAQDGAAGRLVVWIGRRCRVFVGAMAGLPGAAPSARTLIARSLVVNPPDGASALWAIDLALRSPAVGAVVADARGLDMACSRRLQLAAEAGGGLALLARPARERAALSAAATRWLVRPTPARPGVWAPSARWSVELLRRKGTTGWSGPSANGGRRWILEMNRAQGVVCVPADVADRSGEASPAPVRVSA